MVFKFKNDDIVQVEVTQAVVLAGGDQMPGTRVNVTGWLAKQLLSVPNPKVQLVENVDPTPIVERDTEVVVSTSDPKPQTEEEKLEQYKRDAKPPGRKKKA